MGVGGHAQHLEELVSEGSSAASLIRGGLFSLPKMNIVLFVALADAHVGIAIVELTPVLLLDWGWLERLDSVHFEVSLTNTIKEFLSLLLKFVAVSY